MFCVYLLIECVSLACFVYVVLQVEFWSNSVATGELMGQLMVTHEGRDIIIFLMFRLFMFLNCFGYYAPSTLQVNVRTLLLWFSK